MTDLASSGSQDPGPDPISCQDSGLFVRQHDSFSKYKQPKQQHQSNKSAFNQPQQSNSSNYKSHQEQQQQSNNSTYNQPQQSNSSNYKSHQEQQQQSNNSIYNQTQQQQSNNSSFKKPQAVRQQPNGWGQVRFKTMKGFGIKFAFEIYLMNQTVGKYYYYYI